MCWLCNNITMKSIGETFSSLSTTSSSFLHHFLISSALLQSALHVSFVISCFLHFSVLLTLPTVHSPADQACLVKFMPLLVGSFQWSFLMGIPHWSEFLAPAETEILSWLSLRAMRHENHAFTITSLLKQTGSQIKQNDLGFDFHQSQ